MSTFVFLAADITIMPISFYKAVGGLNSTKEKSTDGKKLKNFGIQDVWKLRRKNWITPRRPLN